MMQCKLTSPHPWGKFGLDRSKPMDAHASTCDFDGGRAGPCRTRAIRVADRRAGLRQRPDRRSQGVHRVAGGHRHRLRHGADTRRPLPHGQPGIGIRTRGR
ncbi:hypothetical protein [Lysobacter gummosus]|uniref:hypothetical protein n=1 Tax=Lysobacter gummosus TaxID=262324 RepID=UPI00362DD468